MFVTHNVCCCVMLVFAAEQVEAAGAPSEHYSASRGFVLRIAADQQQPARPGWCFAELLRNHDAGRVLVWKRYLINDTAPTRVLVADSGKYVVTFGEWERNDWLPMVVYGLRGEVKKRLTEDSMLPGVDGRVGDHWMRTLVYFGPDDETLFLRIARGQVIMLWLDSGEVMDSEWFVYSQPGAAMGGEEREALEAFSRERAATLAMEYLKSEELKRREIGAMLAGDLKVRDAIPHLELLLQDGPQDVDWRTGKPDFPGGMSVRRIDPARAAKWALQEIAEDQRWNETGTFLPPHAKDHDGWLKALDRGQQANDHAPLTSFLEQWRSTRQAVKQEVLQLKPDLEQAVYEIFAAFFVPEANKQTAEYLIVQGEVRVCLVDGDLADDFRREAGGQRDIIENRPAISDITVSDFRPDLQIGSRKVLYLDEFYAEVLAQYLTGKRGEYGQDLADSYWHEPNGQEEEFLGDYAGPFTMRLKYLNHLLHIIRGHWGTGWHFATHPEIISVVLDNDLTTAVIYYREGYGGGAALMQRDDQEWRVLQRSSTWVE